MAHVHHVFAITAPVRAARSVAGDEPRQYLTTLKPTDSLEDLSAQLMGDGKKGIKMSPGRRQERLNRAGAPPKIAERLILIRRTEAALLGVIVPQSGE